MKIKQLLKWFKKKPKTCHADEDGINHNMCAMQPSCEGCRSYRK
jgi:hypothetical protein